MDTGDRQAEAVEVAGESARGAVALDTDTCLLDSGSDCNAAALEVLKADEDGDNKGDCKGDAGSVSVYQAVAPNLGLTLLVLLPDAC